MVMLHRHVEDLAAVGRRLDGHLRRAVS